MVNIIKVQCPHCGVEGQLMLPDADMLIVGPCPECNGTVVIFAGKALALDSELMAQASKEEAYKHIYSVLARFIRERLDQVFGKTDLHRTKKTHGEKDNAGSQKNAQDATIPISISPQEFHAFVEQELPLIDNVKYFKSIFG